jgi:hypothetical protein
VLNQLGDVLPNVFVRRDDGALAITDDFELAWQSFGNELDRDCANKDAFALCAAVGRVIRRSEHGARSDTSHDLT